VNAVERAILMPFEINGGSLEPLCVGVAESQARAHDGSAKYYDEIGRADLAQRERKRAAWWRGLPHISGEAAERLLIESQLQGAETIDVLLTLVGKSDKPLSLLVLLANHILSGLLDLAASGRQKAAPAVMAAIGETVNNFEFLATRKPELFREWARGCIAIPGLISRKTEQSRENKKLLESLEQGEDCGLAILPTGKRGKSWSLKGVALIAVRLVAHIRSSNLFYKGDKGIEGGEYPQLPAWRHEAAKLDRLSKRSAPMWAEVAWLVLAEISPANQPERHHVLKKLFKVRQYRIDYTSRTGARLNGAKVTRKSQSIAKHDMKETLSVAFKRIASDKSSGPSRTGKGKHQG
jgi:hypothetical protein